MALILLCSAQPFYRCSQRDIEGVSLIDAKEVMLEREFQAMTVEGATNKLDAIISRIEKKRDLMRS